MSTVASACSWSAVHGQRADIAPSTICLAAATSASPVAMTIERRDSRIAPRRCVRQWRGTAFGSLDTVLCAATALPLALGGMEH